MATVTPREALSYALSREMAILYGVVIAGYALLLVGGWASVRVAVRGGTAGLLGQLVALALLAVGLVAVLAGLIGFVYKVIADANGVAASGGSA